MATKTSTRSTKSTSETTETKRSSKGTSVNRVTLVGRVVATPELRTTGSGLSVTTIRIATNDREVPEFHDVVLWRQQAEFAAKYMAKGRLAYVEGRLQTRTWEGATARSAGRSRSSPIGSRRCRPSRPPMRRRSPRRVLGRLALPRTLASGVRSKRPCKGASRRVRLAQPNTVYVWT